MTCKSKYTNYISPEQSSFQQFCSDLSCSIKQYNQIHYCEYKTQNIIQLFELCIHNIRNNVFDYVTQPYQGLILAASLINKSTYLINKITQDSDWLLNVSKATTKKLLDVSQTLYDVSIPIIHKYFKAKYNGNTDNIIQSIKQAKLLYINHIRRSKGLRSAKHELV